MRQCLTVLFGFIFVGLSCGQPKADTPLDFADTRFMQAADASISLGQLLFFDPVLSGNKNTSCATCHHPRFATTDGVSLAIGEGGFGLGPARRGDPENLPEQLIARNAPALFNLGADEFTTLFHDGRLQRDVSRPSGMRTPLADEMVSGFSGVLSAQAMFPVLSGDEMAGHYSENDVSSAVRRGLLAQGGGAWDIIAARVEAIPAYRSMFDAVVGPRPIKFPDISNAIADFIAVEWRADNSAFDRHLTGSAMPELAAQGLELFYGKANCATCHSGRFQTDHLFHAIAMPQIGPGKAARFESHKRDVGRMRVTGLPKDAYAFRTPSLRNVEVTGPYGHDGAYATLEAVVRHHLDPVSSLWAYNPAQIRLPALAGIDPLALMNTPTEVAAIAAANELAPFALTDPEVEAVLAFLQSLTDAESLKGRLGIPAQVPSGLAVDQ